MMSNVLLQSFSNRKLTAIIVVLTLVVIALVTILASYPTMFKVGTIDVSGLPLFHAILNGTCFFVLVAAFLAIKKGNVDLHKKLMLVCFTLSSLFLLSYVFYHSQKLEPVHFSGVGAIRTVYFFILVSHIILAGLILPLALFTFARALRQEISLHRKLAKITLPLWLYVTSTGVVIYLMLYIFYPSEPTNLMP